MKWVHRFEFNILAEIKCEMNQTGYQWIALEMIYNFVFKLIVIGVEGEPQIDLKVGPFSGINERSLVERPKQKETTPIAQCSWLIQLQVETDSTWWKISADISKWIQWQLSEAPHVNHFRPAACRNRMLFLWSPLCGARFRHIPSK